LKSLPRRRRLGFAERVAMTALEMPPNDSVVKAAPKPRVLVIDGEEAVVQSLQRVFSRRGYEVLMETEVLRGVLCAEQHHPDVVLLDLSLANASGLDVLTDLKARAPDLQVVTMTDTDASRGLNSIHLGAHDYLVKPFDDVNHILNVVRKACEYKQLIDRNRALERLLSTVQHHTPQVAPVPYVEAKRLALGEFNRSYLQSLLTRSNGNVTAASSMAGLDRSNFRRLLKQFGVRPAKAGAPEAAAPAPRAAALDVA
jgi:DNA-binding NtrC family response regulator